jgi:hypothetical protein
VRDCIGAVQGAQNLAAERLGIRNREDFKEAIEAGLLRTIHGFWPHLDGGETRWRQSRDFEQLTFAMRVRPSAVRRQSGERGWLEPADVLNTQPLAKLRQRRVLSHI